MSLRTQFKYRPDVDGLRAIAILAVLAFHANPFLLPGGFVGVDVFFVISGYLISGVIFARLSEDNFSFSDFYIRRIKRIFPSLIVILLASLLIGWFVLLPDEFSNLGKHIAAGGAFVANIVYWQEADYFAKPSELKPLLHLWSLGIEEQFYLIWPPVLYFIWKRRWIVGAFIWLMIIASFFTNVWASSSMPVATFYLPVTRFWELLLCSWLAYSQIVQTEHVVATKNNASISFGELEISFANLKGLCGLLLLSIGFISISKDVVYPGWWALLPTGGTFLLISASEESWINRNFLSCRVLVAIGLMSYPLYLWHWPLLSFGRIIENEDSRLIIVIAALSLSFLLSWLTTRFVEKPARFSRYPSVKLTAGFALAVAVIALLGLGGEFGVFSSRLGTPTVSELNIALTDWKFPKDSNFKKESGFRLVEQPGATKSVVLFIGDSHIEQYIPRVKYLRALTPHSVVFATHEGCPPNPNVNLVEGDFLCHKFFDFALNEAMKDGVKTVVFGAFWERYFVGEFSIARSQVPVYYTNDSLKRALRIGDVATSEVFRDLTNRLSSLRAYGKTTYIILSNPTSPAFDPSRMLTNRLSLRQPVNTDGFISRTAFENHVKPITTILQDIAATSGSMIIDPLDYLCEGLVCRTNTRDGRPKYKDSQHLRATYAENAATFIDQMIVHETDIFADCPGRC